MVALNRQPLLAAVVLLAPLLATVSGAQASPGPGKQFYVPGLGDSIDEDGTPLPLIDSRKLVRVWEDPAPGVIVAAQADTRTIFMNRCPGGCRVNRSGTTNSTLVPDASSIVGANGGTLSAFSQGDAVWSNVMTCMREVFGPFNVDITDVDPSSAPHFEIMVGGTSGQLGMGSGIGGVSPFTCNPFIPNTLVFVFDVWGNDVNEICATAAQEVAHSFSLDHVTDPSDPLTYFPFAGRRHFKDAQVQCGSDCGSMSGLPSGQSPFGDTCTGPTGPNGNTGPQNHPCACGANNASGNTQNSVQTISALFGDGLPSPPVVTIMDPKTGAQVSPGFPLHAQVTDDQGIAKVEFRVDGQLVLSLVNGPYAFNAPDTLGDGTHTAEVTGYDVFGTTAKASVQVIIGKPCGKPADCPLDTDTCIGGRCVPGPGVQGGLGSTCALASDCASGLCEGDASGNRFCVEVCAPGAGQCPSGFGCLENGPSGICYPGYDDGSGGGCSSSSGGPVGFGLGFAALLLASRRKRS